MAHLHTEGTAPPPPPSAPPGGQARALVSVIVPMYNAERHLAAALASVAAQTHRPLQLSAHDDGSDDGSWALLSEWVPRLEAAGIDVVLSTATTPSTTSTSTSTSTPTVCSGEGEDTMRRKRARVAAPRSVEAGTCGPGLARNRAVRQSTGSYLCFLDADDTMAPTRVEAQLSLGQQHPESLIGCDFTREPVGSTARYQAWCTSLVRPEELASQRFRDCTVIQPTWFMSRALFDTLGGYDPCGWAEDLKLFYRLFDHHAASPGCAVVKVPRPLVMYRYQDTGTVTHSVTKALLRTIRVAALERQVLSTHPWASDAGFGIWGAGRNGRLFYRALSPEAQARVRALYDVDARKVGTSYSDHGPDSKQLVRSIPILPLSALKAPFITCVSLDRTDGAFEANLSGTAFVEGRDYFCFS